MILLILKNVDKYKNVVDIFVLRGEEVSMYKFRFSALFP